MATIPLLIAAIALLYAAYIGLGGRPIFGHRERPRRLIGKFIALSGFESAQLTKERELLARVVGFEGGNYTLETTSGALVCRARHRGYAVSLIAGWHRRRVPVGLSSASGIGEIAVASLPSNKSLNSDASCAGAG